MRQVHVFEMLEPKMFLSGNMDVKVAGDDLIIQEKNNSANHVVISPVGGGGDRGSVTPGQFEITGLDGTTINGEHSIVVNGITGHVTIRMRRSDDQLDISDITIHKNLNITLGKGDDAGLTMTNVTVLGNTSIKGDKGDDVVTLDGFTAYGKLNIGTSSGDDLLTLIDVVTYDKTKYDGGSGVDKIQMMPGTSWAGVPQKNFELFDLGPNVNNQTFGINENSANTTVAGTVIATDPDVGDTLTYAITAGNTSTAFAINTATGQLTVNNSTALNHEATPAFYLTVSATDTSGLTDTATMTVNINDVNEAPVVNDQTFGVDEHAPDTTVVGTVIATDQDASDVLTYAITGGNTSTAFAINSATGQLTVNNSSALDYATNSSFSLTVSVTDVGLLSDTATITVNVRPD